MGVGSMWQTDRLGDNMPHAVEFVQSIAENVTAQAGGSHGQNVLESNLNFSDTSSQCYNRRIQT
eukprot:scaffold92528_cov36-Prasinocladus_malaysianus.AAC.3